jgi:hypothetical protein
MFANFIDKYLGNVRQGDSLPSGGNDASINPGNVYLFDRLRYSLGTPQLPLYLPDLIKNAKNPNLNPFKPGNFSIACDLKIISQIDFTDPVIAGLTGVQVSSECFKYRALDTVSVKVDTADLTVCSSLTCILKNSSSINGDLTVCMKECALGTVLVFGYDDDKKNALITVQSLSIIQDILKMSIDIAIDSAVFADIIKQALNTPGIKQAIINALNKKIADQAFLAYLSASMTKRAEAMINAVN